MRVPVAALTPLALAAVVVCGHVAATAVAHAEPDSRATLAAALRAAVDALDEDPNRAREILGELASGGDPLADYVAYFDGRATELAGDASGARERYRRTLAMRPSSPIALDAAARLAPMLLADGATAELIGLARSHADGEASTQAATVALAAGKALADSQPRQAADWLMRARRAAPGGPQASEAASLLSDLRRFHADLRPSTAAAMLDEARLAAREGDRATQAKLLDTVLSRHAGDTVAIDAALLRARVVAGEKGRAEAAAWLEERAERAPSRAAKARLLFAAATDRWNIDDSAGARVVFERVTALHAGSVEAQRARYSLGRIEEAAGRFSGAVLSYRKASAGPDRDVARESRWRAGWVAYLDGDFASAATRFGEIAADASADEPAREEATYWQARSLERAGDRPRAELLYRSVLEQFPDSFYAYLAEQRSEASAAPPTVVALEPGEGLTVESAGAIERAEILDAAGLESYAVEELTDAVAGTGPREQRALLPVFLRLGAYSQALQTALALYRRGVVAEDQLYPYLYPHAYEEIVEREARARGIDPYLVYSLIRQESLFDRRAVSPASAYGLMQLLTSTARRVAANDPVLSGVASEDLFEPEINIRLGVAYLASLSEQFERNEVLMLAGYNAGEQAAERWRTRLSGADRDEFIEQISYRETRDYVKKVLRNYRNYRRLYGGLPDSRSERAQ
jgi:soluble lytic murein transglycosylase